MKLYPKWDQNLVDAVRILENINQNYWVCHGTLLGIIRDKNLIIEYDGSYWHQDNQIKDISKTKDLEKHGWVVIRVRERPLKILSRKFNVSSNSKDYKETANKVLKKINSLGYEIDELDRYLERKMLINKKNADKFIAQLIKEKNKKL